MCEVNLSMQNASTVCGCSRQTPSSSQRPNPAQGMSAVTTVGAVPIKAVLSPLYCTLSTAVRTPGSSCCGNPKIPLEISNHRATESTSKKQ